MAQVRYLGLFPFCVTPTDDASLVGDGTWYPLGFTKEEVCALYWKNKSYNFSVTDIGFVNYGSETTINYESEGTGVSTYSESPSTFTPTIETDFICADVVSKTILFTDGTLNWIYLFGYEFAKTEFNYPLLSTNCYFYNNQYYPLIAISGPIGLVSLRDFAAKNRGWTQAQVDLISVTATCTFLGRTVPLYWLGNVAPSTSNEDTGFETVYVTSGTADGSVVITLDEQWPYDP
jgi:hypothetical protein